MEEPVKPRSAGEFHCVLHHHALPRLDVALLKIRGIDTLAPAPAVRKEAVSFPLLLPIRRGTERDDYAASLKESCCCNRVGLRDVVKVEVDPLEAHCEMVSDEASDTAGRCAAEQQSDAETRTC